MSIFKGSGVAIVTPFTQDGINFDAFKSLIEFQIEEGTDAIIVCGTTGEPSTMSAQEKESVINFAIKQVDGRVPVIVGTGGNNTAEVIKASKAAEKMGADGLLVVTPYYNKCTQAGAIAHYSAVADAVNSPIIVYNVPSRTGFNMTPETLLALSSHPNIAAMKEASANISQISEMVRLCGNSVDMYLGNDDHVFPCLALGAIGVISVVANIAPRDTHDMVATYLTGNINASRQLQFKLAPLVKVLFNEVNPIPVKEALNLMSFEMGEPRLPLTKLTATNTDILKKAMIDYGLIEG